jgi:hypothetical protein
VVADRATGGSADEAMMTGKMPCGATHQGAFDAPFGLGRCRYGDKCDRNRGESKSLVHLLLLVLKRSRRTPTTRLSKKFQLNAPTTTGISRLRAAERVLFAPPWLPAKRRIPAD